MEIIVVRLEKIDKASLGKYGKPVAVSGLRNPDISGNGWKCWYPLGELSVSPKKQIGLVKSDLAKPEVKLVECHPLREEWVYAIDRPVVQVIALGDAANEGMADITTAKAILLKPGQGIIIHAGVWHAPAFAADLGEAYYGFVLEAADPSVKEKGLVPFAKGNELLVQL